MNPDEQKILSLLKRGDEKGYRYLYDHHYVLLCRMANDFVHDPFWAESLVEDVIFHLWEIRETLNIQTSLRSYLMRAVRNRCLDHLALEREKREVRFSNLPLENLDESLFSRRSEQYPLGILLEKELELEIQKAVEAIPPDSCRVFRKSRYEHLSNEEIAQELGITIHTVKYHIKKSLAVLREKLGDYLLLVATLIHLLGR